MLITRLLLVLAILVPAATAESLQVHQTVCKPGTVTKRSSDKVTDKPTFAEALSGFFGSTNLCTDEVVTLSIKRTGLFSGYGLLTDRITCICTEPSHLEEVGCDPGKRQRRPTVTIDLRTYNRNCKKPVFRISKCVTDYRRAFEDACGGADLSKYVPPVSAHAALAPSSAEPVAVPQIDKPVTEGVTKALTPPAGAAATEKFLTEEVGMDPQKAAEIAKDPRKTEDVLNVIAKGRSGDAQSAEAIASNVPELNREDVKKLSDIDPEKIPPATVASVKEMTQAVPDTFERGGTTQAAPPDSAAQEDAFYGYDSSYYPTGYPYASPSYQRGGPFANSNLFSSLFSLLRNLFSRRSSESPASPRPSPSPEASIVVRPQEVTRGNPIFVSWSSVGMSVLSPCQVSLSRGGASTILARGNAGSRAISTHATTTPGVWNFTLECTRPSGTLLKRETSAVVK